MSTGKKVWLIISIAVSVLLTVAIGLGAFMLLTGRISIDKQSVNAKPVTLQDDQLQSTVQQVEYAALSQWLGEYYWYVHGGYETKAFLCENAYVADFDKDQNTDLIVAGKDGAFFVFSFDPKNTATRKALDLGDSYGSAIYIDNSNTIYRANLYNHGGGMPGEDGINVNHGEAFSSWNGQQWNKHFVTEDRSLFRVTGWPNTPQYEYLRDQMYYEIEGKEVTEQAWNTHKETIGLHDPSVPISDLATLSIEGDCHTQLVSALLDHFGKNFSSDLITQQGDYDGDGQSETIIVLPTLYKTWYDSCPASTSGQLIQKEFANHTAILLIDVENGKTVVRCTVAQEPVSYGSDLSVSTQNGYLRLNDQDIYLPGVVSNDPAAAYAYMKSRYTDLTILYAVSADVSDAPGNETIFTTTVEDKYYTYVVGVNGNAYFTSYEINDAIYLVSLNGKPHLMSYYMNKRDGGASYYSYVIYRIAANGDLVSVEENDYTLSADQQDATAAANFFNRFNAYTNNMTVVYDPYRLTGQQWVTPDNATYGTPPAEPMEATGEQLGYVQIKDPKSWLNLREGPGTNYPCIYLEPGNKKSIVKQAQGSPVTILETINTGDAKNPVWYKVRINYAGREIVGYSSQTFIRLANE
ncbi:MAG: hypothetical protein IKT68_00435 [Clostridia bacterium]|nr:hypothetical protein [Clostridia bacterium]